MPKLDLAFAGLLIISIVAILVPLRRRHDPDHNPEVEAPPADQPDDAEDPGFDDV